MSTAPTQSNKLVFAEQEPAFWQEMAAFLLARHSRVELKAAMRQDKHKASEARIVHRRVWHDIRGWIRDQGFDWSDSLATQIKRLFDEYRSSSMETAIVFIEDMELDELIGHVSEHGWLDAEVRDGMRWTHDKLARFKREYRNYIESECGRSIEELEDQGKARVEAYYVVVKARDEAAVAAEEEDEEEDEEEEE